MNPIELIPNQVVHAVTVNSTRFGTYRYATKALRVLTSPYAHPQSPERLLILVEPEIPTYSWKRKPFEVAVIDLQSPAEYGNRLFATVEEAGDYMAKLIDFNKPVSSQEVTLNIQDGHLKASEVCVGDILFEVTVEDRKSDLPAKLGQVMILSTPRSFESESVSLSVYQIDEDGDGGYRTSIKLPSGDQPPKLEGLTKYFKTYEAANAYLQRIKAQALTAREVEIVRGWQTIIVGGSMGLGKFSVVTLAKELAMTQLIEPMQFANPIRQGNNIPRDRWGRVK